MTSRTASRSPASLLACPTVNASGAGTQASRPEAAATSAPNDTGLWRCELDLGARLREATPGQNIPSTSHTDSRNNGADR